MITKDMSGNLLLHWTDLPGGFVYRVYESASVGPTLPPFTNLVGSSASGSTGLSAPMPASNLVFYQVAAVATCGTIEGPQN
jgi:hypothetical protein